MSEDQGSARELSQTAGVSAQEQVVRPWLDEPSERAWVDAETGYPCLATRGPTEAWCGYVGVPKTHPAHGRSYYESQVDIEDILEQKVTPAGLRVQQLVNALAVHGGLTFAGKRDHPDAPDDAHWFGFDCAHAGDFTPGYDLADDPVLGLGCPTGWGGVIEYRTLGYVEDQCTSLARQLKAIADGSAQ